MRLIHIEDDGAFTLVERHDGDVPPYAILSHTWGADHDEITYLDMIHGSSREKRGYRKLEFCRKESLQRRLRYFWIDTCCIDKASSAELTEAINSMFRWYKESEICLVYLSDVLTSDIAELRHSRWFTRGWTLQELIAPIVVEFYSSSGIYLGSKQTLQLTLHTITGTAMPALDSANVSQFDVEERMSWASRRETKRKEDKAYCLLGLFDVYIPLLYGEGEANAFVRLRKEIEQRCSKTSTSWIPGALTGHTSRSPSVESLIPRPNLISSCREIAKELFEQVKQERESVSGKLEAIHKQQVSDFHLSIMHTIRFATWSSSGGILECCTKEIEDARRAGTTAAIVAQHASAMRRKRRLERLKIIYIDGAELTRQRVDNFLCDQGLILQFLDLVADTTTSLQSLLERFSIQQIQYIRGKEQKAYDYVTLRELFKQLISMATVPVLIAIENAQDLGGLNELLSVLLPSFASFVISTSREGILTEPWIRHSSKVDRHTEYHECLNSLTFHGEDTRKAQIVNALQDTNNWIWKHHSYLAWESDQSSILWIEGKAGSGKSVLIKSTQQGLPRSSETLTCDWFFSTRGGSTLTAHTSLLRSVLRQILQKDERTFEHFCELYRRHKAGSEDLWESLSAMQSILHNIISAGFEIRVLIDAMDEAQNDRDSAHDRRALLNFLADLVVGAGTSRFKIIVSSRPLLDMETVLWRQHDDRGVIHRILLQDENHGTICAIVEHGIKALRKAVRSHSDDTGSAGSRARRTRPSVSRQIHFQKKQSQKEDEFLARIKTYLLNHANGVVLWVVAVLNLLETTARKAMHTFADLEAKLKRLPVELSGLYRYHLEDLQRRSDAEELLKVRKALMFISGANSMTRQLTLEELWDALAIPSELEEALKSDQDPIEHGRIHINSWREFWWKLYDLCGPLVEVVSLSKGTTCPVYGDEDIDAKDHVQLSHRTVKDFLADRETAGILAFDDTEAVSLIQQTLQDYAMLVMPPNHTLYCAFTPREGYDWTHALEDLAEYIDDKRLLPWVLDTMSGNKEVRRTALGFLYSRLQNSLNASSVSAFGPLQPTDLWSATVHTGDTVNTYYVDYACSNGLLVAVRIFREIMWLGFDDHIASAVLDTALLVAIRSGLDHMMKIFTRRLTHEPDYRFWVEEEHDVLGKPQFLTRFEIAAALSGNEEVAMEVYDRNHRVRKPMPNFLWPVLSKGRSCWRRSSKECELYREYTRQMKREVEPLDSSRLDNIRACLYSFMGFQTELCRP